MAFSRSSHPNFQKRLHGVEVLEDRRLMAVVIPELNSLPGAAKSIYLDFDGDVQSVWTRDGWQTYKDIKAQASDLNEADIRKVWETVAEDYAPFNVNVTTVQPASFADNVAMRVVIAGDVTAKLVTGPSTTVNVSGNRFIADITDDGVVNLVNTSGWAGIGSFTNDEPNVVYVFGKYLSTWGTTSPEGHSRSLAALVANTASHEAGHSFGLWHHTGVDADAAASNYDVGTPLTTPIMGDNTAADRTLWSNYAVDGTTFNSIGRLTKTLGARADDHPSGIWLARPLTFASPSGFGLQAVVSGIIGTTTDQDWFKFSTGGGGNHGFYLNTVQFANLDAQLDVYKVISYQFGPVISRVASFDPETTTGQPFSGLGASFTAQLAAGDYLVAVKSHGGYGDLGNYTLRVNYSPLKFVNGSMSLASASFAPSADAPMNLGGSASGKTAGVGPDLNFGGGGQGQGNAGVKSLSTVDAIYGGWNTPAAGNRNSATPVVTAADLPSRASGIVDALFNETKLASRSLGKALVA
jgi:hypothetical protein